MKDLFQGGDWAREKHVPVIEVLSVDKEKGITLRVSVGKEVPHPNTTAHHIAWIDVYFKPEGGKFPYQVGKCEFVSHGASAEGADTSGVYSMPESTVSFRAGKGGTVYAASYCNIHGLWEGMKEVNL